MNGLGMAISMAIRAATDYARVAFEVAGPLP